MAEKYFSRIATNLVLTRDNYETGNKEILLQLRQNTGYMDGKLDFACSGHVEKGETYTTALVREAREEIGIDIVEQDLVHVNTNHDFKGDHVQCFFTIDHYEGTPTVCEPEECGGLFWVDIDNLPDNTIPYVAGVIRDIQNGVTYNDSEFTFSKKKSLKKFKI